jgi:FkbM family methyltransferase
MPSTTLEGIFRSLRQYHGDPRQSAAMDALYGTLLKPGDLAFDIGAHVGDRTSCFRRLGARVVAVEPQPLAHRVLRLLHGRDDGVVIVQAACSDQEGRVEMMINSANPTVSTASRQFTEAADGAGGWQGQTWDEVIDVPATTLDALIASHGEPQFTKIDVEGFEAHVLAGLSRPLKSLSFEFTTIQREVVPMCLDRLAELGTYRFNLALGESQKFVFESAISGEELARYVVALPHEANSGDIYAFLQNT